MDSETSRKVILLIDDDRSLQQIQRYALTRAGFEFLSAFSGEEGLEIALERRPDAILLDYMMPGFTGEEILDIIVATPKYETLQDIPIVMLTAANHNEDHIRSLLKKGLATYLTKPFGKKELINVLNGVIFKQEEINEERNLIEKLIHSHDFLQGIINNFPAVLITTDNLGYINYMTRGGTSFTSLSLQSIKGKALWDVLSLTQKDVTTFLSHPKDIGEASEEEALLFDEEFGDIPVSLKLTDFSENDNDERSGLLVILNDLSAVKALEVERIEKEKIKAIVQAMATVNHEINNPLTPIIGNLELLMASDIFMHPDARIKLEKIKESAETIREKVYKLSRISKPVFKQYYKDEMIIDIEESQ